jgi:hypothetical protein
MEATLGQAGEWRLLAVRVVPVKRNAPSLPQRLMPRDSGTHQICRQEMGDRCGNPNVLVSRCLAVGRNGFVAPTGHTITLVHFRHAKSPLWLVQSGHCAHARRISRSSIRRRRAWSCMQLSTIIIIICSNMYTGQHQPS